MRFLHVRTHPIMTKYISNHTKPSQGHTDSCKALAPHPTRPWFITGGTDGVLRLWDARSRRQLSAARLVGKVCSAAFHPAG